MLQRESAKDPELLLLSKMIHEGWPEQMTECSKEKLIPIKHS